MIFHRISDDWVTAITGPLRADAWLMAGGGRCREVVSLEISERSPLEQS